MPYLNKVMLIGNIGKDPETKVTPSGRKRVSFSLATSAAIATRTEKPGSRQIGIISSAGERSPTSSNSSESTRA